MNRILVVEDDRDLNKAVCSFLSKNGYETTGCLSVAEAYNAMYKVIFDLIITDIMMPQTDGFEFAKAVRTLNSNIPILFMTAKTDLTSKRMAYELDADDYLEKPINFDELLLRIGAILRRVGLTSSHKLVIGKFVMDTDDHIVDYDGEEIELTLREFNILYKMLSYPRKTFSRQQLMNEFWDVDSMAGSRTVDVYMTKLRAKIAHCKEFEIQTVHGLGYKMVMNKNYA